MCRLEPFQQSSGGGLFGEAETSSTHRLLVHEAPDSSCDFAGKQDDQAAEELQESREENRLLEKITEHC